MDVPPKTLLEYLADDPNCVPECSGNIFPVSVPGYDFTYGDVALAAITGEPYILVFAAVNYYTINSGINQFIGQTIYSVQLKDGEIKFSLENGQTATVGQYSSTDHIYWEEIIGNLSCLINYQITSVKIEKSSDSPYDNFVIHTKKGQVTIRWNVPKKQSLNIRWNYT